MVGQAALTSLALRHINCLLIRCHLSLSLCHPSSPQVAQTASSLLPRSPAATNAATARHLAAAYGDQVGLLVVVVGVRAADSCHCTLPDVRAGRIGLLCSMHRPG